ncbi:MAG: hypothetical protein J3R72DRAFT_520258 [Linnemannia gamsii]|nr:MAG: hypothetical protein J3R72DRAFT_520258 [Linnemannia gamsii]
MESACDKFFSTPELISILVAHLDKEDIPHLMTTCRRLNDFATPAFFRTPQQQDLPPFIGHDGSHHDPRTWDLFPIPPITRLTTLFSITTGTDHKDLEKCYYHYYMESSNTIQVSQLQIRWLIELNTWLQDLRFLNVNNKTYQDTWTYAKALSGLMKLEELRLDLRVFDDHLTHVGTNLFFALPHSLEYLEMEMRSYSGPEFLLASPPYVDPNREVKPMPRRQGPLTELRVFEMWSMLGTATEDGLRAIFAHCPNVQKMNCPSYNSTDIDTDTTSTALVQSCPKLQHVYIFGYNESDEMNLMALSRIEHWKVNSLGLYQYQALSLTILHLGDIAAGQVSGDPYYTRPPPSTLLSGESREFVFLRALYHQIGELTELQFLDLKADVPDRPASATYGGVLEDRYQKVTLPRLLSLGDRRTGRVGYLHLLKGLKKLEVLQGSMYADTPETMRL